MSQHLDSINLYHRLRYHPVRCDRSLGMQMFSILSGASQGAGGATLLNAKIDNEPVVIKVFPTDCHFRYLRNKPRENTSVRDYGDYEPGTGLLLTELFVLHNLTQNLTTCYNLTVCNQAYNAEKSFCTRQILPKPEGYPIPGKEQCGIISLNDIPNPLCPFNDLYTSVTTNGPMESPQRGDIVRFMMVEKCSGDIQGLIESTLVTDKISFDKLETTLYRMTLMIFHALLLFDCLLNGYSHKDLGARNILYTWDPHQDPNRYWRYVFPSGNSFLFVDIPTNTLIPKIWDFAFVRFGTANQYSKYYEYLSKELQAPQVILPDLSTVKTESRENDVYVFLNDIRDLLLKKNITTSLFNKLDLERIRKDRNNTHAIYDFLEQKPIPSDLLSNPNHDIVHTFPSDMNVFTNFKVNREVIG